MESLFRLESLFCLFFPAVRNILWYKFVIIYRPNGRLELASNTLRDADVSTSSEGGVGGELY